MSCQFTTAKLSRLRKRAGWFLAVCLAPVASAYAQSDIGREIADQVNVANYQHYIEDLLFAHDGNDRGSLGGADRVSARDNIVATLRAMGLHVELQPVVTRGPGWNVVATQRGVVHPSAQFVIGAHYDSVLYSPGADDNASGVAGLLEVARILSHYETAYTVKYVAFDLEERFLSGSKDYVLDNIRDDIQGMISLDMIGVSQGSTECKILTQVQSWNQRVAADLGQAILEYSGGLQPQFGRGDRSDHANFFSFGSCHIIEALWETNPCYHRSCDSVDRLNYLDYPYACKIVRGVAGYLADHAKALRSDCDSNGIHDRTEIAANSDLDCNRNGVPDSCESGWQVDCNTNGTADFCDMFRGTSRDLNENNLPDDCEPYRVIYVDDSFCPGPGLGTRDDPFCRIQDAIESVGEVVGVVDIMVADGVYSGEGNWDLHFDGRPLRLRSEHGPISCIIDCLGMARAFRFESGEPPAALIEGFTIVRGVQAGESGGAVICRSSSPTFRNCRFMENSSTGDGGAMFLEESESLIRDCIFHRNEANRYGGAIYCLYGEPEVSGCEFSSNIGGGGGAISCDAGRTRINDSVFAANVSAADGGAIGAFDRVVINNCTFSGNTAGGWGGALSASRGLSPVVQCILVGNQGYYGGASSSYNGLPFFSGCLFMGNVARDTAGAIFGFEIYPVYNCTIVNNFAPSIGGLLSGRYFRPRLFNSLLWGNLDNSGESLRAQIGDFTSNESTIRYSCIEGWNLDSGEGVLNVNPLLTEGDDGMWSRDAMHDPTADATTFFDDDANWQTDVWRGKILNPDTQQRRSLMIKGNTPNSISILGDFRVLGTTGSFYRIYDYALTAASPCIDAGEPDFLSDVLTTDLDGDPRLNGCRVDIGADEFPSGEPGTGDLNFDGQTDVGDISRFIELLLQQHHLGGRCAADMNENGIADGEDISLFLDAIVAP